MRVLLIHQYFMDENEAGGSRFNEMTRIWSEAGHEITVLAGMVNYASGVKHPKYKGKYFATEQVNNKLNVVRCHVSEAYNVNFLGRLWAYFSFVISSTWAGITRVKGKHDLILVTSPPLFVAITAYVLSLFKRIPFVFEVRDLWPESAIDTGVLKNGVIIKLAYWVESFIYRKALAINVLTPAFREKLIENKGVSEKKILYIPNAADFSLSDGLLNDFDAEAFKKQLRLEGKFVITYVGAHGVANHLIQVLDTAVLLRDKPEVVFLLIGEGMEKTMLIEETVKRGLTASVRFIDSVPKSEVFKYILASDVGASILKKVDTFKTVYSNKSFDYMACKKPIFMLIDGVSRQLVEEAQCGIYIEPENPKRFEEAVREFLQLSHAQLNVYGESGYIFAQQNFNRQVLAHKYIDALSLIVHLNPRP
jgi:glycosyltransferase involved in cell wall biosynthesis